MPPQKPAPRVPDPAVVPPARQEPAPELETRNARMAEMYNSGLSIYEIAKEFSCTPPNVHRILKQEGLELRKKMGGRKAAAPEPETRNARMAEMYAAGLSIYEIAEEFSCAPQGVYYILKQRGVEFRKKTSNRKPAPWKEKRNARMAEMYNGGLSIYEIAKEFSCTHTQVYKILKKRGLEFINRKGRKAQLFPGPAPALVVQEEAPA